MNYRILISSLFILFHFRIAAQNLQGILISDTMKSKNTDTNFIALSSGIGNYQLPPIDFIVFNLEKDYSKLYTGKINFNQLQKDAGFAICCMGRIPPIGVTYFSKGYQSGFVQVGSVAFAFDIKEVKRKSVKLNNLSEYEEKRAALIDKKNIYILEEATISYNKYFHVCFSNIDFTDKERFYSQLTDMQNKKFKGAKADFYFHSFETLPDFFDANGNNIYKLKLYYWDFPNDISTNDILSHEMSKAIFGRDYLLKTEWRKNIEYVITWFEY